jgi:fructose-1,6-bisphosphatase
MNENNLNAVRHEANRHFRNRKKEYLKDKINELTTNMKNYNIRDICSRFSEFNRCYTPRSNLSEK